MDSIPPGSLLALVRPGNDLVLRRIRNLKRCVQACGCNKTTPRYAPQFASRLHFKQGQALQKETHFAFFFGTPFFGTHVFLFFLSPAKVGLLEMQPGSKFASISRVVMLQPHACTQRFRIPSQDGVVSCQEPIKWNIESIWETPF